MKIKITMNEMVTNNETDGKKTRWREKGKWKCITRKHKK